MKRFLFSATPIRPRGDLGQSQRLREINVAVLDGVRVFHLEFICYYYYYSFYYCYFCFYLHCILLQSGDPTSRAGQTSDVGGDVNMVVWGTDVNVSETKRQFKLFLRQFINDLHDPDGGDDDDDQMQGQDRMEPLYMTRLEVVRKEIYINRQ